MPPAAPTPLEDLLTALRAHIDAEVQPLAHAADRVRRTLDAHLTAARAAAEGRVARVAAGALGLPAPPSAEISEATQPLVDALDALRSLLVAVPNAPAPERDGLARATAPDDAPLAAASPDEMPSHEDLADDAAPAEPPPPASTAPLEGAIEHAAPATAAPERALTADEIRAYLRTMAARRPAAKPASPPDVGGVLRALLHGAGEAPSLASEAEVEAELDHLDALTSPEQMDRWVALPLDVQRIWLAHLVARTRALKDVARRDPLCKQRVHEVIVRLPAFAKRTRPGYVNGMRPDHEPERGSWSRDAEAFLSELRAVAFPERPAPRNDPPDAPPRPKKMLAERTRPPANEPLAWSMRERVATMRVVMFGGTPREDARANLQRTLGIGELEWPESDRPRQVDALVERIARRKLDLVLVLGRFIYHKESDKLLGAARASGTPYARVDNGYGVEALRRAIEEALGGRAAEAGR